ncbi:phage portal protein [Photobacterium sp. 1_MG-2023]|uniref:phage portal protein n=1 Tax=Photobacterium sp. 1_MG-2023 TaxID=3062646 RepID=UPI0026E2D3E1|nr:phage portal protein [Photobacterium sp. 1_MG-2023]MDO6707930.1 phage portal protein [Photobacterium sp. 1_MG-2023]
MSNFLVAADGKTPLREAVFRGGGSGFGGQMRNWSVPSQSVDAALLPVFEQANARTDDVVRNSGIAANGVQLHQDHIIGSEYRLSYKPNWQLLGLKPDKGLVKDVEAVFRDIAEDPACFIDAEGKRTFTMLMRESVATHAYSGDIMAKPEWIPRQNSPFATAIRLVAPRRVCNPQNGMDTDSRRAGVEFDRHGAPLAYHVAEGGNQFGLGRTWRRVSRWTANGRAGFIHVFEPVEGGQTRGINRFMSSLEQIKMLDTLQNTTLQRAVVNAMYAASIESELGSEEAMQYLFGTDQSGSIEKMLMTYGDYYSAAPVKFNGVKLPHLFPGDKINLHQAGNADNGFAALEASILRYIAAGLGVDYAQLSRNYSQMSYSTIRAAHNDSWRYFMGRRKIIANRFASMIFSLIFEEMVARKYIRLPEKARYSFYQRRHAWTKCDWIGAGRLAIDGLKEVKEAVMRIESGLSTYEKELAQMGEDYQEIFTQQVEEMAERKKAGLPPPSWVKMQAMAPDNPSESPNE